MPHKNRARRKAYKQRWAKDNKDKTAKYNKRYKQKITDFYREVKEKSFCLLCDEQDVIEFHHIRDKEFSIYTGVKNGVSIRRLEEELKKTISICPNCHKKVHMGLLNRNGRAKYEKILLDFGVNYKYEPKEVLDRNKEKNLENIHNNPPKKLGLRIIKTEPVKKPIIKKNKSKKKFYEPFLLNPNLEYEEEPVLAVLQ